MESFDNYFRRFGVEIEINATDGRSKPAIENTLPQGIHYVANAINKRLGVPVEVSKWHHTHHNNFWVVKPDSSCGIEICSPVSKGSHGLQQVCNVVDLLFADPILNADRRCSFHVHVEVADLNVVELGSVLAHWVKCEWVFMHSVPSFRKRNKYCQCLGTSDIFQHDTQYTPAQLISKLGSYKYFTINTFHLSRRKRPTIEFRIAENEACMDKEYAKNWVMLLIHFVEICKKRPFPEPYEKDNSWSSYLWLNPSEVFELLKFHSTLDEDMKGVRRWFAQRISSNIRCELPGIWSDKAISYALNDLDKIGIYCKE